MSQAGSAKRSSPKKSLRNRLPRSVAATILGEISGAGSESSVTTNAGSSEPADSVESLASVFAIRPTSLLNWSSCSEVSPLLWAVMGFFSPDGALKNVPSEEQLTCITDLCQPFFVSEMVTKHPKRIGSGTRSHARNCGAEATPGLGDFNMPLARTMSGAIGLDRQSVSRDWAATGRFDPALARCESPIVTQSVPRWTVIRLHHILGHHAHVGHRRHDTLQK